MATDYKDKKTPVFDWMAGEFSTDINGKVLTAVGQAAAEQVILKAAQTTRGRFPIYANPDNPLLSHKYGNDASITLTRPDITDDVRLSEIRRDVKEAIIYDPWILDVQDVTATRKSADEVAMAFTAVTIFSPVVVEGVLTNE